MLRAARVPPERRVLLRQADVRYRRQAYELTVPIADGEITRATLDDLAAAFHARHEQTYGHANRSEPVQLVNLRSDRNRAGCRTWCWRNVPIRRAYGRTAATSGSPRLASWRRRCIGATG